MIHVLLITHQHIATAYIKTINSIYPKHNVMFYYLEISLNHQPKDFEILFNKGQAILNSLNIHKKYNIFLLTDLFGASPANIANKLAKDYKLKVISGLNLPMLLKIVNHTSRDSNISELHYSIIKSGKDAILSNDYSKIEINNDINELEPV